MFSVPIESKVAYSSLWTLGGSVGIAVLNAVAANSALLGGLPPLAQFMILAAIPPATTFLAGYVAPPTPRPDVWVYSGPANAWSPVPPMPAITEPVPTQQPPYHDNPYPTAAFNEPPYEPNHGRHRA